MALWITFLVIVTIALVFACGFWIGYQRGFAKRQQEQRRLQYEDGMDVMRRMTGKIQQKFDAYIEGQLKAGDE